MKKSPNLLLFLIFNIEYLNNFKKSLIINFLYHHYIENNYNFPKNFELYKFDFGYFIYKESQRNKKEYLNLYYSLSLNI